MATTLTLLRANAPVNSVQDAYVLITPSGNYVNGGDAMNLASLFGQVSAEGVQIMSDQLPIFAEIESLAGGGAGGGYYEAQLWNNPGNGNPPTPRTLATCLFRAFQANGTEYSSAGYNNSVLSDRIIMHLAFPASA
jgi:hypothetical protein